jgi:hypothetical protein
MQEDSLMNFEYWLVLQQVSAHPIVIAASHCSLGLQHSLLHGLADASTSALPTGAKGVKGAAVTLIWMLGGWLGALVTQVIVIKLLGASVGAVTGALVISMGAVAGALVASMGAVAGALVASMGAVTGALVASMGAVTGALVASMGAVTGALVASMGAVTGALVASMGAVTGALVASVAMLVGALVAAIGALSVLAAVTSSRIF